ncbi:MAG: M28 family peptidase [Planctomycetota bacterium]
MPFAPASRPPRLRVSAIVPPLPLPLLLLPLALVLGRPAGAQAPAAVEPRLAAALDSIEAAHLAADLHFFASDEMRGRDTPSHEQRLAARFLVARLQRLGIAPGAEGGYLQTYPLFSRRLDPEGSRVTIQAGEARTALAFGADYYFSSGRSLFPLDLAAETIFGGSGGKEELAGVEVAGRWVVCRDGAGVSAARRRRVVEQAGAAGLIVLPDPAAAGDPFAARFGSVARAAVHGGVLYPAEKAVERASTPGFPEIFLGRAGAGALLEASPARGETPVEAWTPAVGTPLGVRVHEERRGLGLIDAENVCGFWRGSDPELWKEVVILSAHYDHVGARGETVYHGADDNGSGSIGLLAVAEALARYGPLRRSVLFLWVSGEEKGLFGSRAWTEHPWLPEGARPMCNLNIDMIGRNAPDSLKVTPSPDHPAYSFLTRLAEMAAPLEGFAPLGSADEYWQRSDHVNFSERLDIPVAFLFTDIHEDYHQPTDTPDKIDYDKMRRVCRVVVRVLDGLQADQFDE